VAYRRVQVDKDGTRNIFATVRLSEESLEGSSLYSLGVRVWCSIWLQAMLQQISAPSQLGYASLVSKWYVVPKSRRNEEILQFPGAVTELDTGLPNVEM
jgi:hypothetical protein